MTSDSTVNRMKPDNGLDSTSHGQDTTDCVSSSTEPLKGEINEEALINTAFISMSAAQLAVREIMAFRRLLESPDFACVRKDRGGNFHVTMHRNNRSYSFVAPTLHEAAQYALDDTGGEL